MCTLCPFLNLYHEPLPDFVRASYNQLSALPHYNRPYHMVLFYHNKLANLHGIQNLQLLSFFTLEEAKQLFLKKNSCFTFFLLPRRSSLLQVIGVESAIEPGSTTSQQV